MDQAIKIEKNLNRMQRSEILGHHMYSKLADITKDSENAKVLREIADSEKEHCAAMERFTGVTIEPNPLRLRWMLFLITLSVRVLGLTFVLKLFERSEARATARNGAYLLAHRPEILAYVKEEESHESKLLGLINEERLAYTSSIVLGLNDALVELTGALAGFTLSLQNSRTIALVGLITGISASFSMAASEYLATKHDDDAEVDPVKASVYTGLAYVFTVAFLIAPFLLISNYVVSMAVTLVIAVAIIAIFNYYISVVKDGNFGRQFTEMAVISIGVAIISFFIGYFVNRYIGIDI